MGEGIVRARSQTPASASRLGRTYSADQLLPVLVLAGPRDGIIGGDTGRVE